MPFCSKTARTSRPRPPALGRLLALGALGLLLGACAAFSSDPRVRTPGEMIDDEAIEKVVEQEIRKSDPGFKTAHLSVVSYGGMVVLLGQVSSEALKAKAEEVAKGLAKVRRVHNELGVGGSISYMARGNDGILTSKVKTQLIRAKGVPGRMLHVQTENGVVYLIGNVTREEADLAVEAAQKVYGIQKIVKVIDYLD